MIKLLISSIIGFVFAIGLLAVINESTRRSCVVSLRIVAPDIETCRRIWVPIFK